MGQFDLQKFSENMSAAGEAMQSAASIAGTGGYTIGAAIQGFKDGKEGNTSNYRPINDIEVDTGENASNLVKWLVIGAVVIVAGIIIYKNVANGKKN